MKRKITTMFVAFILIPLTGWTQDACGGQFGPLFDGEGQKHDQMIRQGWIYLFDSRIPDANQAVKADPLGTWRPRRADRNNCWVVVKEHEDDTERILMNILREGLHGTDLVSNQEFRDFDLHLEFRSAENSGIYLRGRYEVQIDQLDPEVQELKFSDLGGIYAVNPPLTNASKGSESWQTLDICIREYTITVYLNGMLIQDRLVIPEGNRRIGTGTEFGCWPSDGFHKDPSRPGPLMIQGNHGQIDLKNIRIRTVAP